MATPRYPQQAIDPLDIELTQRPTATVGATPLIGGQFSIEQLWALRAAIFRSRWLIAAIIGAVLLAGIVLTLFMTPIYRATASIQIDQAASRVTGTEEGDASAAIQDADRFLQTQVDLINSRAMAERVADDLRLYQTDVFFDQMKAPLPTGDGQLALTSAQRRDVAIALLRRHVSTNLPANSRIATIDFESPNAALSARVVSAYAQGFVRFSLSRKAETSSYSREFLLQELDGAKARLAESERVANDYSRRAGILTAGDSASSGTLTSVSLAQLNNAFGEAQTRRVLAEQRLRTVMGTSPLAVPEIAANPTVQSLVNARNAAQVEVDSLRVRYQADYPQLQQARARLNELGNQLAVAISAARATFRTEFDSARNQESALQGRLDALKSLQVREQNDSVDLTILRRQADTDRAQYESLLTRYNAVNAESGSQTNNVAVVDLATVPQRPIRPSLIRNIAGALLIGVILALLSVILREQFFDRLRAPRDVEKIGLPYLGSTPLFEDSESPSEIKSDFAEAIASLRSVLMLSSSTGFPKALAITSAYPAEGKSTITSQLAQHLGRAGYRVLVIDGDMRRPRQHELFQVSRERGLSQVLTGEISLADAVIHTDREGVDVLTAGPNPPRPAELLGNDIGMARLGEAIRHWDHVLIDTPPIIGLADPLELAALAGSVLLVARAGEHPSATLRNSYAQLRPLNVDIVGLVLNGFDAPSQGYADLYQYRYAEKG